MNSDTSQTCSIDNCETVAKTIGLCNKHYMARWRTQQRTLEKELSDLVSRLGDPAEYICNPHCDNVPDRWWGGRDEPICASCAERAIEDLRMDIRRLELKQ